MRYKYLIEKYSYLLALAGLDEQLEQLPIEPEVKEFILTITDPKFKGKIFSEVKKNTSLRLLDLQNKLQQLIQEEKRRNELKDSSLPEEWLAIIKINNYSGRLQTYLRALARGNKLPQLNQQVLDKLSKINHFVEEHRDNPIDNFSFDKLAETAIEWEESFKQPGATTNYEKLDIVYGPEWENNSFNGHYITEVTTKDDLFLEGTLLNHCVKGPDYYQKVKNKETRIFSLRDPAGRPLVTMEVSPDLYNFKQTFGYNNSQPNAMQNSMINEWKQSLHPKGKILQLTESSGENKIKAAQFMNYNDPDYRLVIDKMLLREKDSGKGFIGSAVENSPKDVLQALAANETLSEQCYEKIYAKCANNTSTFYCLVRNPNIGDNLFIKIYLENKDNPEILAYIASSFKLPRSSQADQIINHIVELGIGDTALLNALFNNPSIPSSKIKPILDNLDKETIFKIFKNVSNFDPKFIDDILESNNPHLRDYYFSILSKNDNLNPKVLEKLYRKYGKPGVVFSRLNLLKTVITRGVSFDQLLSLNNDEINANLAKNFNLTEEQFNRLLSLYDEDINANLAKNPNLTPEQFNQFLELEDDYSIKINLAANPNLTSEQFNQLLELQNNFINNNLAKNPNLTSEQFNQFLELEDDYININLARNTNLTSEQFNQLLKLEDDYINNNLAANPNLTTEQIDQLLALNNDKINDNLAKNSNLTSEQFNHFLELQNNYSIKINLAQNPNLKPEQADQLLKLKDNYINDNLATNPNLTEGQFNQLLALNDEDINNNLAGNPNLSSEQIDQLLALKNKSINRNLAENPNLTLDQALLVLKHKIIPANFLAKNALQNNKTASKYDKLLKIANNYKFMAEKHYMTITHSLYK